MERRLRLQRGKGPAPLAHPRAAGARGAGGVIGWRGAPRDPWKPNLEGFMVVAGKHFTFLLIVV